MAWVWVVYSASLGCQPKYVSLGLANSILAPITLVSFRPQLLTSLQLTCGIPCPACNLAIHITLVVLALLLWYMAPFAPSLYIRHVLRGLALLLVILDAIFVLDNGTIAAVVSIAMAVPFAMSIVSSSQQQPSDVAAPIKTGQHRTSLQMYHSDLFPSSASTHHHHPHHP